MSVMCDVVLWRKPATAILVLAVGTLVFYHCHVLQRSLLSLVADTLLVLACAGGALGVFSRQFNSIVPVDPLQFQLSMETAQVVAACAANLLGAAEGVLRVAASGSDYRLFAKVVTFFYFASALGRACSGTIVAYMGLWFVFVVPYVISRIYPERATQCPKAMSLCRARSPRKGCLSVALEQAQQPHLLQHKLQ